MTASVDRSGQLLDPWWIGPDRGASRMTSGEPAFVEGTGPFARIYPDAPFNVPFRLDHIPHSEALHRTDVKLMRSLISYLREALEVDTVTIVYRFDRVMSVAGLTCTNADAEPRGMAFALIEIPIGTGFAGQIAVGGEPLLVRSVRREKAHWAAFADVRGGARSILGVPLVTGGRVVGVLWVGSRQLNYFGDADIPILQTIGERATRSGQLARAIKTKRAPRTRTSLPPQTDTVTLQPDTFLSMVSAQLASSLDYATTLQTVAHAAVPHFADCCFVDVARAADGSLETTVATHPPWDEAQLHLLRPPFAATSDVIDRVIRTGEPLVLPRIPPEWFSQETKGVATAESAAPPLLPEPGSCLCVPLVARRQILGTMLFLAVDADRYGEAELELGSDLARRCAIAIDNSRLYREAQNAIDLRNRILTDVTHDLASPLTVIRGYTHLLRELILRVQTPEATQVAIYAEQIEGMTRKIDQQLGDLAVLARSPAGELPPLQRDLLDLVQLIKTVIDEQQRSHGSHQIWLDTRLPELVGNWNALRLERMATNLIQNAIKYSPASDEVHVAIRREDDTEPAWAVVEVRDEGIGIPAAELPRIFERFQRASNIADHIPGSGVGLAVTREIVEQHGGSVSVTSVEGKGSTFTVRLPL